jgi:hypothetical protein
LGTVIALDKLVMSEPEPLPVAVPLKHAVETAMDFLRSTLAGGEKPESEVRRTHQATHATARSRKAWGAVDVAWRRIVVGVAGR